MLLPSVFLHSGFVPKPILTEGPSQQTDRAENLKQWIHQQGEEIKTRYGEDVEIEPFPILLAEMEEVFGSSGLVLASPGYKPSQRSPSFVSSAPVSSSSRQRRRLRQPSAAAATAKPSTPAASTAEQPTLAVSTSELSLYAASLPCSVYLS
ncbi:hypothetical protein ATANTOWER_017057 [Ataeniobius toweri]|uniref:Uncharacterized protein n=1 Tax=Ataeniobius toweri TaxID=208326 RepID=A0ABU7C231_9TELE|nr:hypothetical protein [Ataeniobius toweri]